MRRSHVRHKPEPESARRVLVGPAPGSAALVAREVRAPFRGRHARERGGGVRATVVAQQEIHHKQTVFKGKEESFGVAAHWRPRDSGPTEPKMREVKWEFWRKLEF